MPFLFFWDCNLFNIYTHMECDWTNYRLGNSWHLLHDTFGKNHALWVSRLLSTATSNAKWSRGRCLVNKFHGAGFTKISNVFEQLLGYDLFIFFPFKAEDLYFAVTFPGCKAITENCRRPHKYANRREITGFNGSAFK